jgi:two-component system sensor kinase FixL
VYDCPDDLPPVQADPDQLRIVFSNLVRNAREAMPNGGSLTLSGRRSDGRVEVSVADTGVGIAPEHLARVMEPLYTTKARGMGLGLALARAILEKNKGSLRAESVLEKGTTFTVLLTTATG